MKINRRAKLYKRVAMAAAAWLCFAAGANAQRARIASISVEASHAVTGPDGTTSINKYGHMGLSDEHSTIFPPGTLPLQSDYLFFVASPLGQAPEAGLIVMRSTSLPDSTGQWSLDFDSTYGLYWPANPPGQRNGPVFTTTMAKGSCPATPDPTFDLNYAAPGSVFVDPTNPRDLGGGSLLMVYEGTTSCVGTNASAFYSTIGIATSLDFGHTWPTYRANFTPLPEVNPIRGPMAPDGAWGHDVCWGNFCSSIGLLQPSNQYGRYAVSGPATTIEDAMQLFPDGLPSITGDSEPAAFVDDVRPKSPTYVYIMHNYDPGPLSGDTQLSSGGHTDLAVSRIQLNGGSPRLQATHWYLNNFYEAGLARDGGGRESSIFPDSNTTNLPTDLDYYQHCLSPTQRRSGASISYSEATDQYLLVFVCLSQTEPATQTRPAPQGGDFTGGAWFYSTIDADVYDLSHQDQWSVPNEIQNSWTTNPDPKPCTHGEYLDGWYPSLMSLGTRPGHLAPQGYVFYMNGCISDSGRAFSTRAFTIHLN